MATSVTDPKKPETKPHGTTEDQIKEMESEGNAAASDPDPDAQHPNVEEPGNTDEKDCPPAKRVH